MSKKRRIAVSFSVILVLLILKLLPAYAEGSSFLATLIPSGNVYNVKDFGARGDGIADDTDAIQKAVDYAFSNGGGIVYIPDGIYSINPERSITMRNGINLRLAQNCTLKAIASDNVWYRMIAMNSISNASVTGGNIVGDRTIHNGTTGEWGFGIEVLSSTNIRIADIKISDCWGDGIYIGDDEYQIKNYCENIIIENVICDNNRRQGCSVISVKGLIVRDSIFCNSNGTSPEAGFNMEPNFPNQFLQDVVIENMTCTGNSGLGINAWFGFQTLDKFALPKENTGIKITNLTSYNNKIDINENIYSYLDYGYISRDSAL